MRCGTTLTASLVLLLAFGTPAVAQRSPTPGESKAKTIAKPKPAPKVETKQEAKPAPQPAPSVVMPDAEKIVLLVRTTLMTLNDAIQTGNFTVLRDKAAPGFREANSAARLGQAFSDLASRNVDLSVASVMGPQLTEAPVLDQEKGMLNIKGFFRPSRCRSISRCSFNRSPAAGGCSASRCSRQTRHAAITGAGVAGSGIAERE
jgi:hypothetical protein